MLAAVGFATTIGHGTSFLRFDEGLGLLCLTEKHLAHELLFQLGLLLPDSQQCRKN